MPATVSDACPILSHNVFLGSLGKLVKHEGLFWSVEILCVRCLTPPPLTPSSTGATAQALDMGSTTLLQCAIAPTPDISIGLVSLRNWAPRHSAAHPPEGPLTYRGLVGPMTAPYWGSTPEAFATPDAGEPSIDWFQTHLRQASCLTGQDSTFVPCGSVKWMRGDAAGKGSWG